MEMDGSHGQCIFGASSFWADKFRNDQDDTDVDTAFAANTKILFHFIFFSKGSSLIFWADTIALKTLKRCVSPRLIVGYLSAHVYTVTKCDTQFLK